MCTHVYTRTYTPRARIALVILFSAFTVSISLHTQLTRPKPRSKYTYRMKNALRYREGKKGAQMKFIARDQALASNASRRKECRCTRR